MPFVRANMTPEKRSSITKSVDAWSRGASTNMRTPLKIGAKPSAQTMWRAGTTFDTVGVNVRFVPGTWSLRRSPSRMSPSMSVTVEFQREKPFASVNRLHTISAVAAILTSTRQVIAKMPLVRVNRVSPEPSLPAIAVVSISATFRLARFVEGDRFANERLEGGLVNFLAFVDVDRAPDVSFETRVEETRRIFQRRTLGECQLHDALVRLAGAD